MQNWKQEKEIKTSMLEEGTANICSNIKVYIELIYEFSKVGGFKINIQKCAGFL